MEKVIKVENKTITLYYDENSRSEDVPVVILNTFDEEGQEIWNEVNVFTRKEYILVTIANIDWNKEMSPWYMEKMYKNEEDYAGKAEEYLHSLTDKIIPEIERTIHELLGKKITAYTIVGYSLAGLFAIYSLYQTHVFKAAISCSGSLWYPDFIEYVKENEMKSYPEKIYFSLGNKEKNTKNELMAKVEENTKSIEQFFSEKSIQTIYEENEGNHFQDVTNRVAKGIRWILEG